MIHGPATRDLLRRIAARTGYPVVEAWSSHNEGQMKGVWGVMCHHTGSAWSAPGDYPTLRVVRDGRSDLQNSLCAFGIGKSGTIYLISEKLSWHAGAGAWNGMTDGNGYTLGIEAESDGVHWAPGTVDCYPRLVAAALLEIGSDDKYSTRHASYALPAGRKNDFANFPGGNHAFWAKVYDYMAHPEKISIKSTPTPAPPAPPAPEENEMQLNDPIPNANGDTKAKQPTTTVSNTLQDIEANAWAAARNTAAILMQVQAQAAALDTLAKLVAQQNGLTVADVQKAVQDAVAAGVKVDVNVHGNGPLAP